MDDREAIGSEPESICAIQPSGSRLNWNHLLKQHGVSHPSRSCFKNKARNSSLFVLKRPIQSVKQR